MPSANSVFTISDDRVFLFRAAGSQYENRYDHCRYDPPRWRTAETVSSTRVLFADMDMLMGIVEAGT